MNLIYEILVAQFLPFYDYFSKCILTLKCCDSWNINSNLRNDIKIEISLAS